MVVYRIPRNFEPTISSHGNSKDKKPFYPTWPSTCDLIKSHCSKGPKAILHQVSSEVGGLTDSAAPGELPRSEKQVTRIRSKEKSSGSTTNSHAVDELFVVMQRAHSQDPSSQFVRGIRTTPDPAIVVFTNNQLNDMIRFCTSAVEFCILTVDPTFSLGDFDVTPITYRHLLLETDRGKTHPVFLGPTLIHYRKTFATYLFFSSTLIGASPALQGIRAFGTDGEQALSQAFKHGFPYSHHLLCSIHMRRNVKEKCKEYFLSSDSTNLILNGIFGTKVGDTYTEGLVDAMDDADFQNKLDFLIKSWQELPMSSTANLEGFVSWFKAHKSHAIQSCMIRSIREECGLGSPPLAFTTNASESINAVIKNKVDYKKTELPAFIDKLKELEREQQSELERAIIGRGKYRFREQYKFLEISESKWFQMSSQQRKEHLLKLQSVSVKPLTSFSSSQMVVAHELPLDVETAAAQLNIPISCLEGIWSKASKLLVTDGALTPAPGQSSKARMVLSYSGRVPHMVVPKKNGEYSCDSNCPNWNSMGICSHCVVVAHINGELSEFVAAKGKRKKAPNVSRLLATGMPKGRGCKGGVPSRSKKQYQDISRRIEMNVGNVGKMTADSFVEEGNISLHNSPYSTVFSGRRDPWHQWSVEQQSYGTGSPYVCPPYYDPCEYQQMSTTYPYTLHFITGNISSCFGCKNKYKKPLEPPNDLCIQHQDWREYIAPSSSTPQRKFSNVYYHCRPQCIQLNNCYFIPSELQIPDSCILKLNEVHKRYLQEQFGLHVE